MFSQYIGAAGRRPVENICAVCEEGAYRRAWVTAEEAAGKQQRWSKSVPHGTVQRGGANSSHQPPILPDMPSHSTRETGSYRAQKRGLSVGVLWNFLRTGGRRLAALAVRWLVAGSVPARFACPGQDGGAAGRGLSGVFRRLRVPTMRRAGAGRASAAIPGTGGRAGAPAHSWRYAAAAVLLAFAALLALPLQAEAQTAYVSNTGQSDSPVAVNTNASISQAQGFTTGSQSGGTLCQAWDLNLAPELPLQPIWLWRSIPRLPEVDPIRSSTRCSIPVHWRSMARNSYSPLLLTPRCRRAQPIML